MSNYYTDWVECSCGSHAVSVSHYVDPNDEFEDSEVYLSIWGPVEMNDDGWRWRIRRAWDALRGNLHLDQVVLHPSEAVKLQKAIADTLLVGGSND